MKLMHLFDTLLVAVLALGVSALTAHHDEKAALETHPHLGSAFRDDTTLSKFMSRYRAIHANSKSSESAEATRSTVCARQGFKASQRAGCVAFMRHACRAGHTSKVVSADTCSHFFQQSQPGYNTKLGGEASGKGAQQGDDEQNPFQDLQEGPNYDSKKAQKATDKAADKAEDDPQPAGANPLEAPLEAVGDAIADIPDAIGDAVQPAQQGPNYDKKSAQKKTAAAHGAPAAKQEAPADQPEDKDAPQVQGCRNSVKGWKDAKGNDCEDYAEGEWCNRHGGYGDAWLDEWGSFEDVATNGKSAKDVCCVCGGGLKDDDEGVPPPISGGAPAAASPAGAPAGAPAGEPGSPAPAITGPILGTKAGRPLQSQGYSGRLVAHEDMETMTSDWQREFGPKAGHKDIKTICQENPGNEWCDLHGYYDKERESRSAAFSCKPLFFVLIAFFVAMLR